MEETEQAITPRGELIDRMKACMMSERVERWARDERVGKDERVKMLMSARRTGGRWTCMMRRASNDHDRSDGIRLIHAEALGTQVDK